MESSVKHLLDAEQQANELVRSAIADKQKKLREAKAVAEKEIEKFRAKLENEFDEKKTEKYGEGVDTVAFEAETREEIAKIDQKFSNNQKVVDFLRVAVMKVHLEIPRVVRGRFEEI